MNLSPALMKRLLPIGAVVAPVVLLHSLHTLLATGPSTATATNYVPPTAAPELPAKAAPKLTFDQERAVSWLKEPSRRFAGRSPMDHVGPVEIVVKSTEPERPIEVNPPAVPPPTPAAEEIPVPRVTLTTILSRADSAGGSVAVMSGRAYKLGDPVSKGWTVTKIDRDSWSVTMTCDDGRTAEVGSTRKP